MTGWIGLAITATVVVASLGAVACGGGSDGATATPVSNERPGSIEGTVTGPDGEPGLDFAFDEVADQTHDLVSGLGCRGGGHDVGHTNSKALIPLGLGPTPLGRGDWYSEGHTQTPAIGALPLCAPHISSSC